MILSGINLELTLLIFLMIPIMIVSCTWFNMKVKGGIPEAEKPDRRIERPD